MKYENLPEYPMTTYGEDNKRIRKRVQRIRLPHFTSVDWTEQNPLLQKGEIAVESDTRRMKIGDGVTRWNDLEYIAGSGGGANVAWGEISGTLSQQDDLQNALDEKINKTQGTENAGKVLLVGNDGEVTLGDVSGGGGEGGLTEVAHDDSLTGKGTTASPLKLSSTIQNSISEKASTTYVDNQIAAVTTGYENADQQIKSSITNLSNTVSTLRTDHDDLGEQVSGIESKIPGTTTESNPLVNESRLLEEEMDIRSDLNAFQSELQTQINAQAAKVTENEDNIQALTLNKQDKLTAGANITIVDNVISATSGGGSGEGGITEVTHNESLTGMGTATSPLGIDTTYLDTAISTNAVVTYTKSTASQAQTTANEAYEAVKGKQDIIDSSSYITAYSVNATEMGADSMYITRTIEGPDAYFDNFHATSSIETPELTVGTDEGTLNLSIAAGTATIATNNGLDIVAQTKFDTAPTTDDTTAWADVNATALVTKAQVTTALGTAGGADLPDQTDNAGKFLTTDGTTASWSDKPLVNKGTGYNATAVMGSAAGTYATSCGINASASGAWTVAVGYFSAALEQGSTGVGYNARAIAEYATQLGKGENSDANTFKVGNENGNFEMMSADGTIPAERYTTTPTDAGTYVPKLTIAEDGTATREWGTESGGSAGGLTEVTIGAGLEGNGTSDNPLAIDTTFLDTTISANSAVSTANQEAMSARSEAAQALTLAQANEQALANKQDTLTEQQLLAVNSGITADKVSTYDGYATQIEAAFGDVSAVLDSINGETLEG